jgi:hypothetical protein
MTGVGVVRFALFRGGEVPFRRLADAQVIESALAERLTRAAGSGCYSSAAMTSRRRSSALPWSWHTRGSLTCRSLAISR